MPEQGWTPDGSCCPLDGAQLIACSWERGEMQGTDTSGFEAKQVWQGRLSLGMWADAARRHDARIGSRIHRGCGSCCALRPCFFQEEEDRTERFERRQGNRKRLGTWRREDSARRRAARTPKLVKNMRRRQMSTRRWSGVRVI